MRAASVFTSERPRYQNAERHADVRVVRCSVTFSKTSIVEAAVNLVAGDIFEPAVDDQL